MSCRLLGSELIERPFMSLETLVLLFLAGLSAGFVDAVAGGGGLISIPSLLWAGLTPQMALGTNKMQSTWGTAMAVRKYMKAGLVRWKDVQGAAVVTFVAASIGTWVVTQISNEVLKLIVPWLLLAIAIYVVLSPKLGVQAGKAKLSATAFAGIMGVTLGFYDGFFGPGTGTFWTVAGVSLLGLALPQAAAYTKVVNLSSNLAALGVFLISDRIHYPIAMSMIAGQLIGGRLGAGMAIKHGAGFIRFMFLAVVFCMILKLFWEQLEAGA